MLFTAFFLKPNNLSLLGDGLINYFEWLLACEGLNNLLKIDVCKLLLFLFLAGL